MNMMSQPYSDIELDANSKIRIFDPSITDDEDYVWHRDREDRDIRIIEGDGWMFQFDNELPFCINKGDIFHVPKMVFHRIIPGSTILRIRIDELVDENKEISAA